MDAAGLHAVFVAKNFLLMLRLNERTIRRGLLVS